LVFLAEKSCLELETGQYLTESVQIRLFPGRMSYNNMMMEEDIYSCDEEEGADIPAPWEQELGENILVLRTYLSAAFN
jgi:hypothetical protein